jgi:thioredoxin-like negative regulator of GroEL
MWTRIRRRQRASNVRSIPTLLVLKAGQEVDRIVGVQPKAEIARRLQRVSA